MDKFLKLIKKIEDSLSKKLDEGSFRTVQVQFSILLEYYEEMFKTTDKFINERKELLKTISKAELKVRKLEDLCKFLLSDLMEVE